MPRALRACPVSGCPELTSGGRCPTHLKDSDQRRGTRQERGYGRAHETRFRRGVLLRDPLCVCTDQGHGHGAQCLLQSSVADHWPLDRRELVARGLDANNPERGRGLCKRCHDKHTSVTQPGGWHQPTSR